MKWYLVLLGIMVNGIWFFPIVWELLSTSIQDYKFRKQYKKQIKKANEEYRKNNTCKSRRLCINCSYCRWKRYHPFGHGKNYWAFVSKTPQYCRKFKKTLRNDSLLRCVSEFDSEAMYED